MNKLFVSFALFLFLSMQGFSQKSMSDYSYIIVSEQFEFQDEKDKYQLNSLTKFLFNKYGFHAYFDREVPRHLNRCDGLYADAEGKPGFIITKVELVIRDCNGVEVFRSIQGKSKIKDYKKAYYEAAREAFVSVRDLYVNQKPINTYEDIIVSEAINTNTSEPIKVTAVAVVSKEVVAVNSKEISFNSLKTNKIENLPAAKFSSYSYADKIFLLRKTKEGYSFYEESSESDDGLLLVGKIVLLDVEIIFTDTNNNKLNAQFDASNNLIINKGDSTHIYKLEH